VRSRRPCAGRLRRRGFQGHDLADHRPGARGAGGLAEPAAGQRLPGSSTRSWSRSATARSARLRDREPARPLPQKRPRPRPLSHRAGSAEMLVPRRPQPRPYGSRPTTLEEPLETRTQRLRNHLRRTNQLTMATALTPFFRQTCTAPPARRRWPAGGTRSARTGVRHLMTSFGAKLPRRQRPGRIRSRPAEAAGRGTE
jgi:hypothetical protein